MPAIRIDTADLTYPWFWLPGHLAHFLDGSVPGGAHGATWTPVSTRSSRPATAPATSPSG